MKRNKPLYAAAVDEAIPALVSALDAEGVAVRGPRPIVQAVVRAYLAVAQDLENARTDGRISPLSRRIAALAPGAGFEFSGQSLPVIRQRFKTARDLMGNPDARWRCESRPNGVVFIERLPDGSRYHREPTRNPKVRELISLKPGETVLSKTLKSVRGAGQMGGNTKVQARKALGDPNADWSVKQHGSGVRLTRIR